MSEATLRTPLHDAHIALGARMVPFAGYDMPVQYVSIIAESKAVREGAGVFDVSHMARVNFKGEGVIDFLELITTNDIGKLRNGQGQYSLMPNENGGVVDDIIVYRVSETEFEVVFNAANHAKDVAWAKQHMPASITMTDNTLKTVMLAVQGPKARAIVASLSDDPAGIQSAELFDVRTCKIAGIECFAACSGYTGEDGFELVCGKAHAEVVWNALLAAGVTACGLGARDTLRVEAGLPLYGHELTDDLSPIAAGLGWVISKTKSFIGSGPINAARESGTPTKLQGIRLETKRLLAPGMKVFVEGTEVGEVSSGVVSPLLDTGIAFAFIRADIKPGTECTVEVRGRHEPAVVANKRFFKRAA